nr:reverse transcriptase domain-containing protein [Tanacetum cinerariifolium]
NKDFLLEEVDAFLVIEDETTSSEFHKPYLDLEGYILLLESFLNDDPSLPPPIQRNYMPEVCKELKIYEAKTVVELKALPPHLEYAFLEGDNKLPVIIAKDLSVEEKTALLTVLKSYKRAIAWKLSDIKGINPEFCTHEILIEEDFTPAVQHQRRVNPQIHDVIKQEVIKLLDAGLIYPISDSPWPPFLSRHSIWFLLVLIKVPHGLLTSQTTMRGTSLLRACHLSRKANSLKMSSIIFGMTPICLKFVLIKSSKGVYLDRKLLISLKLATLNQQESREIGILSFLGSYLIALRKDTQHLSVGDFDPQNTDGDATFKVKEPEFEVEKPESEIYVSLSSSAKSKKHDDKTKREAKGKSLVELSIGFRNLSEEFEDFSDNSINEVNAASTPLPAVGQILTNSTNTFSAAGPSNIAVSPTHGKSFYVDPSQYPDDLNMPALEDITYSDDEDNVGAEVDFTNLEITITVSPIPTTTVHKDHPVTQIIGDLSLATQTKSMTRMVKDQGGLTQINNEDFHT